MVRAAPVGDVSTLKVPLRCFADAGANLARVDYAVSVTADKGFAATLLGARVEAVRSEEHTSELQVTNAHLVCRLLLETKKNKPTNDRMKTQEVQSIWPRT